MIFQTFPLLPLGDNAKRGGIIHQDATLSIEDATSWSCNGQAFDMIALRQTGIVVSLKDLQSPEAAQEKEKNGQNTPLQQVEPGFCEASFPPDKVHRG